MSRQCDVFVAGGGPGGFAAAIAAARNGADTLLVERYGFLGGMATMGLVNPFMTFWAGQEQIIEGIFQEMIDRLKTKGGWGGPQRQAFDPEIFKLTALDLLVKPGLLDAVKSEFAVLPR